MVTSPQEASKKRVEKARHQLQSEHSSVLQPNTQVRTALFAATERGHLELMRRFIEGGTDINAGLGQITPLYEAVRKNRVDMVRLLLSKGAEVDRPSPHETPLCFALSHRQMGIACELLAAGAKLNNIPNTMLTALLDWYVESGALVLDKASLMQGDDKGRTPLHHAAYSGRKPAVATLLKLGAPIDHADHLGQTALHYAAWQGDHESVATLLEHGATINVTDMKGRTPLHHAARRGHAQVAEQLLDDGACIHLTDVKNQTAYDLMRNSHLGCGLQTAMTHLLHRNVTTRRRKPEGPRPQAS